MGDGDTGSAEGRFRVLFDDNRQQVLAYVARRAASPADAADVVAETFLVAWRRLDSVPAGDEVPWLIGVARLLLRNQQRGDRRRQLLRLRLHEEASRLPGWHEPEESSTPSLRLAMSGLSQADRELLQLTAWDGLSPAQISVVLHVSAATVRTRLTRARARLRRKLDKGSPHPATADDGAGAVRHVARGAGREG